MRFKGLSVACSAAAILFVQPANARGETKIIRKIKIDNLTFRVVVTGNSAKVASTGSAFFAPVGARYFALARRAVETVSGCKVTQTDNFRATLYASLDCSGKAIGEAR